MYRKYFKILLPLLIVAFCAASVFAGTTGKIAGTVIDAESKSPIPGANVMIVGTRLGAATDINGNYTILHVPPGVFSVTASVIGYSKTIMDEVRVQIDQTSRINFALKMEVLAGQEITVVAERKPVQVDVSTSVTSVSAKELKDLPISSVTSVVALQAGVQGMNIRGSNDDKSLFLVDGVTMRDPRDNKPITTVPLSAVQEVSIERGGFNAEYGQVQSGVVNVVTREGSRERYQIFTQLRYNTPHPKYFDISPFDRNSLWLRPYLDDQVCWTGTKVGWDKYTQRQYPEFVGWNEISRLLMANNDPTDDLSPLGAQRVYLWEHRKRPTTDKGDYDIDVGFGGPVPLIGNFLGGMRFFSSYRQHREMLLVPLNRADFLERDFQLQMLADISPTMKLRFTTMHGKQYTMTQNWVYKYYLRYPWDIANDIADRDVHLFSTGYYSDTDISHQSYGLKLTHTLTPKTFYEVSLEYLGRDFYTRQPAKYDTTRRHEVVPGFFVDDAPFGFSVQGISKITSTGFGGHSARMKDESDVWATTLKADLTSQVTFLHLLKAGFELVYNKLNLKYGLRTGDNAWGDHVERVDQPIRASFYFQDKLETKGFVVNMGLRLDYSNANTDWYQVDPYDESFFSSKYQETTKYATQKTKGQYQLSPRLGISHPITENSKLFFNYGHFKQMPTYEQLFQLQRSPNGLMQTYGNPNLTLARTIAYELGYDHSIQDNYLIQLAAFYKDITDQQMNVAYIGLQDVRYNKISSNAYADIRGFELTLRKTRGIWWSGFANYTYLVTSSGFFERDEVYQDPSAQQKYDRATENLYQERPIPRPYARLNLSLYTPRDFGPELGGVHPLSDLLLNVLGDWQDGGYTTWNPKLLPSIQYNVKQVDWYNFQLRISKGFTLKNWEFWVFADIYNVLNTRRFSGAGYFNYQDQIDYWESLHLPASPDYDNIPGDDKFGTYRLPEVAYQPVERRGAINRETDTGDAGVIYWERASRKYFEYVGQQWQEVSSSRIDKINKDKAYIDMPNKTSFNFLDPRQIFFGIRANINL
ncbi:TonB-dependent receptor [candidate division KSB1 bacterium]|nr:TonB-dependent receptor [candidate division KSB1 bacterium]